MLLGVATVVLLNNKQQYGRLLAKIRDEFNAYVDSVSRNNHVSGSREGCACGGRASSNQSSSDLDFGERLAILL